MSIPAISNTPVMDVCPVFAPPQVPVETAVLQSSGITLPSGATIPFDMMAQYLLTVLLEDENQYLDILTRLIRQERAFKQMQEGVRIRHFETQLRDETHLKHIAKAGKIASKAEIVVAGIQAMLSGNVGGFVTPCWNFCLDLFQARRGSAAGGCGSSVSGLYPDRQFDVGSFHGVLHLRFSNFDRRKQFCHGRQLPA